eukprot:TRINITY_DN27236_c0_g1_i1.p1 TRINITY_DN27236_c0_g1~~TRINITY_DN27236_c0_g1_i1.p1  ORF type:complete len:419 (+),score=139.88 TRINITY_DN27236_c0_g1_i1:4-1260(+)
MHKILFFSQKPEIKFGFFMEPPAKFQKVDGVSCCNYSKHVENSVCIGFSHAQQDTLDDYLHALEMINLLALQRVIPNRAVYDKLFDDLKASTDRERAYEIFHTLKQIQLAHPRTCCKLIFRGVEKEKCKLEEWEFFKDLLVNGCSVLDEDSSEQQRRQSDNRRLLLTYFVGFFTEEQANAVPVHERTLWRLVHTGDGANKETQLLQALFACLLNPDPEVIDLLQVLFDKLADLHFRSAGSSASVQRINEFNDKVYRNFSHCEERLQVVFLETCTNMWAKASLIDSVLRCEYAKVPPDPGSSKARLAAKPVSVDKFGDFYYQLKPKRKARRDGAGLTGLERFVLLIAHVLQAYVCFHRLVVPKEEIHSKMELLSRTTLSFANRMHEEAAQAGSGRGAKSEEAENVALWVDEMTTLVNCY